MVYWQFGFRTNLCFTNQETQEENLQGGTNSLVGQFLHPSLVQSSRSIQHMLIVHGLFFCRKFGCTNSLSFTDQGFFERNELPDWPVFKSTFCRKLKIHIHPISTDSRNSRHIPISKSLEPDFVDKSTNSGGEFA